MPRSAAEQPLAENSRSLVRIELLESLKGSALQGLERRCTWQRWRGGEQIIDRETLTNDVYFITAGRVRVIDYAISGHREVVFDEIVAGGFFGELAAIDGEPRSVNIVASAETMTASLPADDFINLLFEHRDLGLCVMRRLSEMVRQSTTRIMDLSTVGAHNRIHAELLRLAKTGGGGKPNTATIHPIPVHSDIAARVSTTRETVARVLSDLAHRNLVKREGDTLLILDLGELNDMVHKFRD